MNTQALRAALAALVIVIARDCASAQGYDIIDLGTLGGSTSVARAINERGEVVGRAETAAGTFRQHAFLWRAGRMIDLGVAIAGQSDGKAINTSSQVAGVGSTPALAPAASASVDLVLQPAPFSHGAPTFVARVLAGGGKR